MQRNAGEKESKEKRLADFRLFGHRHATSGSTQHADRSAPREGEEFSDHPARLPRAQRGRDKSRAHTEMGAIHAFSYIRAHLEQS